MPKNKDVYKSKFDFFFNSQGVTLKGMPRGTPQPLTNLDDIIKVERQRGKSVSDADRTWQPWRLNLLREHVRTGALKITPAVMKRVSKLPKIRQLIVEEVCLRTIKGGEDEPE